MCIRDRPTPAAQPITLQNARRSPHPRFQPMTRRNRRRGTACGASGLSQAPTDVSQEPENLPVLAPRRAGTEGVPEERERGVLMIEPPLPVLAVHDLGLG